MKSDTKLNTYFWRTEINFTDTKSVHLHLKYSKSAGPAFHFLTSWLCALSKEPRGNGIWETPNSSKRSLNLTGQNVRSSLGKASEWQLRQQNTEKIPTSNPYTLWFLQDLVNINIASVLTEDKQKGLKLPFSIYSDSSNLSEVTDTQTWCWLRTQEVQFPRQIQLKTNKQTKLIN